MNYIKISIGKDLSGMDEEFHHAVHDIFRMVNPFFTLTQQTWHPPTDIFETPEEFIVTSELAGVNKEDIHVETDHRMLKIYGLRREKQCRGNGCYALAEIASGYFERIISLSHPIDGEAVTATYADGLLEIHLKKRPSQEIQKISLGSI